jgi:hypothetical protein
MSIRRMKKRVGRKSILGPFPADLPGVTIEWLAKANNCSARTVRRRRRASLTPGSPAVAELLTNMTLELALEMALLRPPRGVLPFWSRMAIAQLAAKGATYSQLMQMFSVGRSTVYRSIHRAAAAYCPLTGRRQLTKAQVAPPPKRRKLARLAAILPVNCRE